MTSKYLCGLSMKRKGGKRSPAKNKEPKTPELHSKSSKRKSPDPRCDSKPAEIQPAADDKATGAEEHVSSIEMALGHVAGLLACSQILTDSEIGFLGNVTRRLSKLTRKKESHAEQVAGLDVNNNPVEGIPDQGVGPEPAEELGLTEMLRELALNTAGCRKGILELDLNNNESVAADVMQPAVVPHVAAQDPYRHINFQACQGSADSVLFENNTFTLSFDIGTPRPHFIILLKGQRNRRSSVKDLTEPELVSMLELCEDFIGAINARSEEFTLAFHTGKWASCRHFHGHLCCETALYLRILSAKQLDAKYLVPSKNWQGTDYVQNVLAYEHMQEAASRVYKLKSLAAIEAEAGEPKKPAGYQLPFANKRQVELLYDTSEPHLVFQLKEEARAKWSVPEQRLQLLRTLVDWTCKQGFYEGERGSHLCLALWPQQKAYVHMDAHLFHRMHPRPELFLARFSDLSRKCYIST